MSNSNSSSSSSSIKNSSRAVSFSTVEIRKYPVILGDHPDCHNGPPITIDWIHFAQKEFHIEKFEKSRRMCNCNSRKDLIIPATARRTLLKRSQRQEAQATSCTDYEIDRVIQEIHHIRKQREETLKGVTSTMNNNHSSSSSSSMMLISSKKALSSYYNSLSTILMNKIKSSMIS